MKERSPKLQKDQLEEVAKELLPEDSIREALARNDKGNPKPSIENMVMILEEDPSLKGAICLNELTGRTDIVRDLGWKRDCAALDDTDMAYLALYIEKNYGINCKSSLEDAIRVVALQNCYHPIRDILNSLEWDGVPRLDNMLFHFFGADKSELIIESLKVFMMGAVCRVFDPGCKFELSICIIGDQGVGKSTFFRFLAIKDEYFSDDLKRLDDEKIVVRLLSHWIIEMSEMLAVLNSRRYEEYKSFLSRQKDTYRTPYEKHPKDRLRQCVFGGTSNKLEILPPDKSGNRRTIPIESHMEKAEVHIMDDEEASRAYIMQAWAEIMVMYKNGNRRTTLPEHLVRELEQQQVRYTPEDPEQESIEEFLAGTKEKLVCIKMLAYEALGYPLSEQLSKNDCNRIAEIMHHIPGWECIGTRKVGKYGKARAWKRTGETVPEDTENPFIS